MKLIAAVFCAAALLTSVITVDRNNFKTCDQSSFCRYVSVSNFNTKDVTLFPKQIFFHFFSIHLKKRRCRKVEHNNSPFELVPATLNSYSDSITADLINKNNGHFFVLKVEGVKVRKNI